MSMIDEQRKEIERIEKSIRLQKRISIGVTIGLFLLAILSIYLRHLGM